MTPLTAMNRLGKSLKDVNVNLTFTAQQLAEISEIPLQKDSMFEEYTHSNINFQFSWNS